ncbi:uncharacterized protein BYT42DRAFT_386122 [Radiomyces spectabilis]|uniref:uncharacterized protein n=1 Tax=Radiomyces spectabilis TaxID=64574 RepID=UPI0022211068|nr:uncharacterized protein BYT42DRAFT_386122 [Radiomyces spectabilis]KAI8376424.1 hypothetical protein BYT42DRAFT_386122 [Radiomyces spectabilis]
MVQALDLPLLALAVPNLQKLNDLSADELSCMWTVFSKCKDNLEHGRRLENMSWRLWFRETASQKQTCNEPHPTQNPIPIQSPLGSPHSNYSLNESPNSTAGPQTPKDHDRRNSSMKQASTASFKRIISSLGINKPDSRPLNVLSHTDHLPTNVKALCNPITPITPVSLPQVPPSVPESQPLNAPTPITARPGKFFIYAEDESDHGDYRFSSDDDDARCARMISSMRISNNS